MSKSPLGMQYAGQYQVQECKLVTHAGVDVDLEGVLIEANIYEELFSNNNFTKSSHPKIFYANEKYINYRSLKIILKNLALYCESNNLEEIENILKIPEINYLGSFSSN